jgi:hypothetical protein
LSLRFAGGLLLTALLLTLPAAAVAAGPLLATGDSMIQYVDTALDRKLSTRVISDAQIGTGISKPLQLDWVQHAGAQVGRWRPGVTVLFLGANDGFDMRTPTGEVAPCCGRAWRIAYGRRAATMMRTYARAGEAQVFWLTLPQAREGFFRRVYPAVNAALRRAARDQPRGRVTLIRLNKVFTPGGRYRDTMLWRGKRVTVRQRDGIHLSPAGADIAASLVLARLRGAGVR